jgi:chromodomain-helicase-DNA-binding protein 1
MVSSSKGLNVLAPPQALMKSTASILTPVEDRARR